MTELVRDMTPEKQAIIRKYNRENYAKNRSKRIEYERLRRERNKEACILQQAKCRAKKYNLPFNLELSDIKIPLLCPILGIPLSRSSAGRCDGSPSLDRIIPSLGYVKDNIIVISNRANRIKSDASLQELTSITEFYRKLINDRTDTKAAA